MPRWQDLERWILTEIQRRGLVLTEQSAALWQLSASLRSESPKSPDESKAPLQAVSEAPSFHVYSATVPFDVLCQYAEILHIQKEDVDGGFFPFTVRFSLVHVDFARSSVVTGRWRERRKDSSKDLIRRTSFSL